MIEKEKNIWLEGQLVDWSDAKLHVLTHSLHYGLGSFEGIRAYNVRAAHRPCFGYGSTSIGSLTHASS